MKLIDKDALVAEIEKLIDEIYAGRPFDSLSSEQQAALWYIKSIMSSVNTLEVKGVDLEKEIIEWHKKHFKKDGTFIGMSGFYLTNNSQMGLAKHFFELGFKAQHDNWKVVDNTNLPQADKNKIYCVFTKQRYILATVINHPQDGELLQWKCTEFPNHRYDMCEGDKYMQIV